MGFQSFCRFRRRATSLAIAVLVTAPFASNSFAAAAVEEVVVTAQRTEESIQDVPIAVSAFTGTMLEDKQIISPSDLQMNTPNVSFSNTNFGGASFSIRGIGNLAIAATADAGVSIHLNELAMPTRLSNYEFYDMERVEVLRGPQGTLFGKNATGGVVNMITAKPSTEAAFGNVDVEYGNYADQRIKGAFNLPVTDTFAVRVAGMSLKRDGYIDNTAKGQVGCANGTGPDYPGVPCTAQTLPGLHNDVDNRDQWTYRVTAEWNMTENASGWLLYSKSHENDRRVRFTSKVCQQNPLPVQGCLPDGFGFQSPNPGTGTGGIFFGMNDVVLLGDTNPPEGFPVYKTGFRKYHSDFDPIFKSNEDLWEAKYQYNFDKYTVILLGGYQSQEYMSRQDYAQDVGYDLAALPAVPAPTGPLGPILGAAVPAISVYPTSQPAGFASKEWTSSQCNYEAGTAGVFGGCTYPTDGSRIFVYDQSDSQSDYWSAEARLQSNYDGMFNFLLGANYSENSGNGDYYVLCNCLDLNGVHGTPAIGIPSAYPTFYDNTGAPNGSASGDSTAYFGELYFQVTDAIKITAGLRYNDDNKSVSESAILFNSINMCQTAAGGTIAGCYAAPQYVRSSVFAALGVPGAVTPTGDPTAEPGTSTYFATQGAIDLMNYYGLYGAYLTAYNALISTADPTAQFVAYNGMVGAMQGVPLVPTYNETRKVTNSPTKADWQETTGRLGVDWRLSDDIMLFAFYTRGYKPGGFNPALNPEFIATSPGAQKLFDSEKIDAYEIGTKSAFMDGGLVVNASGFYYDYSGLQLATIANNTAINGNYDATIYGFELETFYVPAFLPNLQVDVAYSYLNTRIDNTKGIDPLNRTAGDPNWTTVNNIDAGSLTGVNYIVRTSGGTGETGDLPVTPALVQAAYAGCAAFASYADGNLAADPNGPQTCTLWTDTTGATVKDIVATADGTVNPATGIPSYFSRSFLAANGVAVAEGIPTDLDGNRLPQSPENTVHVGVAYTIDTAFGSFTPRVDYYWQGNMYAREYNTKGDFISSWDQWNASLLYQSKDGRWEGRAWVRNLTDEDNITGKYLTSDTSGFYRNYFLTEPRVYGASFKYNFGPLQ